MKGISSSLFAGSLLALAMSVVSAHAQLARTFVSSLGDDGNNCNRLTPCRTFQRAHDATLSLGEITVLDPGGYGAVTINKNISIINDGVGEAGILVSGGLVGITINAPADANISLRGITIKGIGFGGGVGIVFNSGALLSMERCVVRNLTAPSPGVLGTGILFQPDPQGGTSNLSVSDTVVADNTSSGIYLAPRSQGFVHGVFTRVQSNHNGFDGIAADNRTMGGTAGVFALLVENSAALFNARAGFETITNGNIVQPVITVIRSVAEGNLSGFLAHGPTGTISVGQSSIQGNKQTWFGLVQSFGDNYVFSNFDNDPPPPGGGAVPKK